MTKQNNIIKFVGFEPTFINPLTNKKIKIPEAISKVNHDFYTNASSKEDLLKKHQYQTVNTLKNRWYSPLRSNKPEFEFFKGFQVDYGIMELPSKPMKITFVYKYTETLFAKTKDLGLVPSSKFGEYQDGGCHINVSFVDKQILKTVFTSMRKLLTDHPYIAWAFLNPIDRITSRTDNLTFSEFKFSLYENNESVKKRYISSLGNKDKALLPRVNTNQIFIAFDQNYQKKRFEDKFSRLEFRFFEMPKTKEEFKYNFLFLKRLIEFSNKYSTEILLGKSVPYKKSLSTAKKDLKQLFIAIGMDPKLLTKFKNYKRLKERYSYGKKYLN